MLHRGWGPDALIGSQSFLHPGQIQKLARILLLLVSHFELVYLFGQVPLVLCSVDVHKILSRLRLRKLILFHLKIL